MAKKNTVRIRCTSNVAVNGGNYGPGYEESEVDVTPAEARLICSSGRAVVIDADEAEGEGDGEAEGEGGGEGEGEGGGEGEGEQKPKGRGGRRSSGAK